MDLYNHEEVTKLKASLLTLKTSFDKITETATETSVNNEADIAVIGGGSSLEYTPETIIEIATNVKTIRDEIIE